MLSGQFWMAAALAITLTGCTGVTGETPDRDFGQIRFNNQASSADDAASLNAIAPAAGIAKDIRFPGYRPARPVNCSVRDRFDRKSTIAYNFEGGKSRLGLHLDIDGPSLSNPGQLELEAVTVNYRYRFQALAGKREKCLYKSGWQGLLGSGYNEFFRRESNTVYEHLDDEWDYFTDELEQFLKSTAR